jgi:hypothetical protein
VCEPGTGGTIACPCANPPDGLRRGCDNSAGTGGASLSASGGSFLAEDTLVLAATGLGPNSASVLMQGTAFVATGYAYGQGVRCMAGTIRRLYPRTAHAGSVSMPDFVAGEPSISARSAALGVPILAATSRWYLIAYRDPIVPPSCPSNRTWNLTQTGQVAWQP